MSNIGFIGVVNIERRDKIMFIKRIKPKNADRAREF